jgi:hypothetical protein
MCDWGPVDAIQELGHVEVSEIGRVGGGGVVVVMAAVPMVAEAMEMLDPQVQVLKMQIMQIMKMIAR